jgi:hypothetical protein
VIGASALVGAGVAKAVVKFAGEIGLEKAEDGSIPAKKKDGTTDNKAMLPEWAPGLVPVVVAAGIAWGADKYSLKGQAKNAAVGVAAGMFAYGIGKTIVAVLPKAKADEEAKLGDSIAKYLPFNGLSAAVDNYDTGLLAGLGEIDATVAAYMNRGLMGSPTQVQTLSGAPILVQDARAGMIGSPTIAQQLSGAPLSATLM